MVEIRRYVTRAGKDLIGDWWQVWTPVCERKLLRGLTDFLVETSAIANLCARECPNFESTAGRDIESTTRCWAEPAPSSCAAAINANKRPT
jgi:hypothetical protein